jgi:flagellar biosynthesis/type III secretory pathway chaperone
MAQFIIAETDILERELRQYEHLVLLLKRKQESLISSNTESIRKVTYEIEEAIARIKNLEKERSKLLDQFISEKLTRPAQDAVSWRRTFPDDITTEKDLIAAFRSHDRVKTRLRSILEDVRGIQETNRLLIDQGREILQSCLECLLSQVTNEVYDSRGMTKKQVDPKHNIVDHRI